MKLKSRCLVLFRILCLSFLVFHSQSCSESKYRQDVSVEQRLIINPPSMVEKLWLARHHYDEDRRLIIPKVGGSRWGAVQEYTAEGDLVYRDWWVRNLKVEDLEASPSLDIQVVQEEDSSSRPPVFGISGIDLDQPNDLPSEDAVSESKEEDPFSVDPVVDEDPFAPVPDETMEAGAMPSEVDPFAPLPVSTESAPDGTVEPDPFGPLPDPF